MFLQVFKIDPKYLNVKKKKKNKVIIKYKGNLLFIYFFILNILRRNF